MKYDIKDLTLEEKLDLMVGTGNFHTSSANGKVKAAALVDGPSGLRIDKNIPDVPRPSMANKTDVVIEPTAMPTLVALCNTWNPELAFLEGETIAEDCIDNNVDIILGPGMNIKRTPLCGRNFEYFSEDPFLAGSMAKAYVQGVQSKNIGVSVKHYCANNREFERHFQSSEVDERTLREIYLTPFEMVMEAKPWTVMSSYNQVNGVYMHENKWLLKDVLRGEFSFDGLIVSDWCSVREPWRAIKATVDLFMPYLPDYPQNLRKAYAKGLFTEAELDERVEKVLQLVEKTEAEKHSHWTKEQRHENAVTIAKESIVLLKNENNLLPLKEEHIFVVGNYSSEPPYGGGGSGDVVTDYKPTPLYHLLSERLGTNTNVHYSDSLVFFTPSMFVRGCVAYREGYRNDVTILSVGTNKTVEFEGGDREKIRLSVAQEQVILNTAKFAKKLVVIVHAGSAVDMSPWIDKVDAVLFVGFAGEGVNEALADILCGKIAPSGKLSETFPLCLEDTPTGTNVGDGFIDNYAEGIFVGYRWYEKMNKPVLFPFGHGLSYAQFEYSDLKIEKVGDTDFEVSYTVKNTSNVDAKEISQVYVKDVFAGVSRPEKELKGFSKDFIKAGESKRVCLKLNARSFAYYSVCLKKWYIEGGTFEIFVGASSADIRLKGKIDFFLPEEEQVSQQLPL